MQCTVNSGSFSRGNRAAIIRRYPAFSWANFKEDNRDRVCVCVFVYVRACVHSRVRACVSACVRVSIASDFSKTFKATIVDLGTVTVSEMRMHHVLIRLTLWHSFEIMKIVNIWLLQKLFNNAHHVFCEHSPIKGQYGRCQFDDLDLHSRSQVRLKLDYFLTCNITGNI